MTLGIRDDPEAEQVPLLGPWQPAGGHVWRRMQASGPTMECRYRESPRRQAQPRIPEPQCASAVRGDRPEAGEMKRPLSATVREGPHPGP